MGALGAPREGAGWSGALRWPLAVLPTHQPADRCPCRGCPPAPPPGQPSPQGRTQAGTVQGAGRDNRAPFVAGVWGCHWWPGVGGEGTAGPGRACVLGWEGSGRPRDGGAAGESRSLAGWHQADAPVGREPGAPQLLIVGGGWTDQLGTDASETWWEVGGAPLRELVTTPPPSCDVGLTLFLPHGGPLRPETRPGVQSALSHHRDSSFSFLI